MTAQRQDDLTRGAEGARPGSTRTLRLLVLSAGLSTPSSTRMLADALSRATAAQLREGVDGADASVGTGPAAVDVEVRTVELRELAHDIADAMLTRFPSERLADVHRSLRAADAVIAVTPIFNIGASGLFSSFLDVTDTKLWADKPVLLGATAGTARHSLAIDFAIRPVFGYLRARVVPTAVFAASGDMGSDGSGQADATPLDQRIRRAAGELATMIGAGGSGETATRGAVPDAPGAAPDAPASPGADAHPDPAPAREPLDPEFADFIPMDDLLRR